MRAFLGITGQYRKFIKKNYAQYVAITGHYRTVSTLNQRTQLKKVKFSDELWTEQCENSFVKLKELLTSAPVLGYLDFNAKFHASYAGLGGILYQYRDNKKIVIA